MAVNSNILVKNSFCYLQNFPENILKIVREALTYKNEDAFQQRITILRALKYAHFAKRTGNPSPYIQKKLQETGTSIEGYINQLKGMLFKTERDAVVCLVRPDASFPTGLISIVRNVLKGSNFDSYSIKDERVAPEQEHRFKWKSEPKPPRYYQSEVAEILSQQERGVIEACVASGKTDMMKQVTFSKRVTTLIVVPSNPLLTQIGDGFEEAFGKTFVQTLKSEDIKKGTKKLKPIRITTIQTLAALKKAELLQELIRDVNMVLFDEFHHAASTSYTDLLNDMQHIYYRYGFTGTFLRNDSKTLDLWGVLSNRVYYYPPSKAIEEGYITKPEFRIYSIPGIQRLNYQKEYEANYCGSPGLLKSINSIVSGIDSDKQVLILVDRKDKSGAVIKEFMDMNGIDCEYISGDDKKDRIRDVLEDFNSKKIRVLIGSTVIGEGIDLYSTDHLILATGGKSEIKIVQAIGRAVRLAEGKKIAYIHDFRFSKTKFLEKHLEERLDIYREQFAGEINYAA